jgi:hypothetical protein
MSDRNSWFPCLLNHNIMLRHSFWIPPVAYSWNSQKNLNKFEKIKILLASKSRPNLLYVCRVDPKISIILKKNIVASSSSFLLSEKDGSNIVSECHLWCLYIAQVAWELPIPAPPTARFLPCPPSPSPCYPQLSPQTLSSRQRWADYRIEPWTRSKQCAGTGAANWIS